MVANPAVDFSAHFNLGVWDVGSHIRLVRLNADRAYNTLHFASKVVCQGASPFGNPRQQNRRYATLSGSIPPFVVSSPFHGLRVVPCKLT